MSRQSDLLREIAAAINAGSAYRIADWFTEEFRLHEPAAPPLAVGHMGAAQMLARSRTLEPPRNLEILAMVEEGDRVRRARAADRDLRRPTLQGGDHGNVPLRGGPYCRGLGRLDPGNVALKVRRRTNFD